MRAVASFLLAAAVVGSAMAISCPSPTAFSRCIAPLATVTCNDIPCDCSFIAYATACASAYCPAETLSASIMSEYTTSCLGAAPVNTACPSPTAYSQCLAPLATVSCVDNACACSVIASATGCASAYCPGETLSASVLSAYSTDCLKPKPTPVNTACPSLTAYSNCVAPLKTVSCVNDACVCSVVASQTACASSYCPMETLSASILSLYTADCLSPKAQPTPTPVPVTTATPVDTLCPSPTAFSNCVAPLATVSCTDAPCACNLISSATACASSYCPQDTLSASILSVYSADCLGIGASSSGSNFDAITTPIVVVSSSGSPFGASTTPAVKTTTTLALTTSTTSSVSRAVLPTASSTAGAEMKFAFSAGGLAAGILAVLAWL